MRWGRHDWVLWTAFVLLAVVGVKLLYRAIG
jgi:putative Mn2+ efflux pump MntP